MGINGRKHETILYVMGMLGILKGLATNDTECNKEFESAASALSDSLDILFKGCSQSELVRIKKETEILDISIAPKSASKRTENWIAMPMDDLEFFLKDPLGECYFCVKTDSEVKACLKRKKLKSLYIDGLSRENCPYKGL